MRGRIWPVCLKLLAIFLGGGISQGIRLMSYCAAVGSIEHNFACLKICHFLKDLSPPTVVTGHYGLQTVVGFAFVSLVCAKDIIPSFTSSMESYDARCMMLHCRSSALFAARPPFRWNYEQNHSSNYFHAVIAGDRSPAHLSRCPGLFQIALE